MRLRQDLQEVWAVVECIKRRVDGSAHLPTKEPGARPATRKLPHEGRISSRVMHSVFQSRLTRALGEPWHLRKSGR
jgi:hypothetical protein